MFNPPPKVRSAVVRLTRNDVQRPDCDEALLRKVVKTTFNQRRKMMRSSVKPLLSELDAKAGQSRPDHTALLAQPVFSQRPEQLSVADFVDLTNVIAAHYGAGA